MTPAPLLTENESVTLRALLRISCGVEIELPDPQQRHLQCYFFSAIYRPFAERRAQEMADFQQRRLLNPKG